MQFIKTQFYLNKHDKLVTADIFNNNVFMHTLKFSYELITESECTCNKLSAKIELIEKHNELFLIACAGEKALLLYGTTDDLIQAIKAKAKAFVEHELEQFLEQALNVANHIHERLSTTKETE